MAESTEEVESTPESKVFKKYAKYLPWILPFLLGSGIGGGIGGASSITIVVNTPLTDQQAADIIEAVQDKDCE